MGRIRQNMAISGLHTARGMPRWRAMFAVGNESAGRVNHRNDFVQGSVGEKDGGAAKYAGATASGLVRSRSKYVAHKHESNCC